MHSQFVSNQHNTIGDAAAAPDSATNSIAYCAPGASCTTSSTTNAASANSAPGRRNAKRRPARSDATATAIVVMDAQSAGGTERSCVVIVLWPKVWMIVGAK